jgi:hypothetical protein
MMNSFLSTPTRRQSLTPGAFDPAGRAQFWLQGLILLQMACQIALLFEFLAGSRVFVRSASFGISLALLFLLPGRGPALPARRWALASLVIVILSALNPEGNTVLSRLVQIALYLAILGPVFWVPRLQVTPALLHRLLLIFWLFHSISAGVGVLQVVFPGHLQPAVSKAVRGMGQQYVDDLKITLADGQEVFRPMGLTDIPGGACMAGLYATLFGLGFFLQKRAGWIRVAGLGSMGLGLFCIYLSQVRSVIVVAGVCLITFAVILVRRGELKRVLGFALVVPALVLATLSWAISVGGDTVTDRLATLTEDRVATVYYNNRGHFLEETFTVLIWEFPTGAGLGRWGMANSYFGDNSGPGYVILWAEIQWTGWLFDGGIPLMVVYAAALLVTLWSGWRIALHPSHSSLGLAAALITAYNIGALATIFSYPLFIGQGGLEFWLLNACLYGADLYSRRRAPAAPVARTKDDPAARLSSQPACTGEVLPT